jgi:hypothetical protein
MTRIGSLDASGSVPDQAANVHGSRSSTRSRTGAQARYVHIVRSATRAARQPRPQHPCRQRLHERQWTQHQVRRCISPRCLEPERHLVSDSARHNWPSSPSSTPRRVSRFISRAMTVCSSACSASSVGAAASMNSGTPSAWLRYTPSSTRQCRWMFRKNRAEALNQRHRAAPALASDKPGRIQQAALESALHRAQHRRDQFGMRGQQQPQRDWQRQHPLPHWHLQDDVIHQVRRRLRHAPRTARCAKIRVACN